MPETHETDPIELARQAEFDLPRDEYIARMEKLVFEFPGNEELRARKTLGLLSVGELDQAQELADEHFAATQSAESVAARARLAAYANDLPAARGLIDRALASAPNSTYVAGIAIQILQLLGESDRALAMAEELLAMNPSAPRNYHRIVSLLILQGKREEAARRLNEVPESCEGTYWNLLDHARIAMVKRDLFEAEQHLRKAVAIRPNNGGGWAHLSGVLRLLGKWDEAESAANFALEYNPRNPVALRGLAEVARKRGKHRLSDEYLVKARDAVPVFSSFSHFDAASQFLDRGMKEEALRAYREFARTSMPVGRRLALGMILVILADSGQWDELRKELGHLNGDGAEIRSAALARARLLDHDGDTAGAVRLLQQYRDDGVDVIGLNGFLLIYYSKLKMTDKAEPLATAMTATAYGSSGGAQMAVRSLNQVGRKEEANKVLAAALRAFPNSDGLRLLEALRLKRAGQLDMAMHIIRTLPPHMQRQFLPSAKKLMKNPKFWRALGRLIWRRLTGKKPPDRKP